MSDSSAHSATWFVVWLIACVAAAHASERSQLLSTDADVAYNARRYAEAQLLFDQAAAADPQDAEALYGLGMSLAKLERWEDARSAFERVLVLRPEWSDARRASGLASYHLAEAELEQGNFDGAARHFEDAAAHVPALAADARQRSAMARARGATRASIGQPVRRDLAHGLTTETRLAQKRWDIHAGAGVEYDSNVALLSDDTPGKRADAAFLLAAGTRYDVVHREEALVRLNYDLEESLHPVVQKFDLRTNRLSGTASYALLPEVWAGIEGGYVHHALGSHGYLEDPFVLPFLTVLEGSVGRTQLYYRHGQPAYLSLPFKDLRDGQTNTAGVTQLLLSESGRYASIGYQFEKEDPRRSIGDDYRFMANQVHVGVGFPAWWQTALDLAYVYRNEDYTEPNSAVRFRKTRADGDHYVFAAVRRSVADHVGVSLTYYGTIHTSNIEPFDYRRHQVALLVQFAY